MATTEVMRLHSAGEEPRPRFDYRGKHRYTITLEVSEDKQVFTTRERVLKALSMLREAAAEHRFEIQAYSFLPSRVLLLVQGKEETSYMKGFLSAFRSGAHAILVEELGHTLWKKTYRERVLRKGESTPSMARDIWRAAVDEKLAPTVEAYEYQGSFVKWLRPGGKPAAEYGSGEGARQDRPRAPRPEGRKPYGDKPRWGKPREGRPEERREGPGGERRPPRGDRPFSGKPDFRKSGPSQGGRPDFRKSGPSQGGRPDFRKSGPSQGGRPDFRKSGPSQGGRPDFRKSGPSQGGRPDFRKSGPSQGGRPDFRKSGPSQGGRPDFRKSGPSQGGRPFKPRGSGPSRGGSGKPFRPRSGGGGQGRS